MAERHRADGLALAAVALAVAATQAAHGADHGGAGATGRARPRDRGASSTKPEVRHPLRLAAGQTVRITARSRAFDPFLKLYGPTGTEPLAKDDDTGGGTVAELTFKAEARGPVPDRGQRQRRGRRGGRRRRRGADRTAAGPMT